MKDLNKGNTTLITSQGKGLYYSVLELTQYKDLILILAWKDLRIKYAQTFVGFLWAFLNPIINLLVLTFVFGVVVKVDTQGIPHILFTLAGISAWTYFSTLLSESGQSLIYYQQMIKKIYFPKLTIPISKSISGLVDLGVTLICLLLLLIFYKYSPSKNIIWLPVFILLSIIAGLGGGIWISAVSVRFRDFKFVTPLIVRLGLFLTPIAFPASAIPEKYKLIYFFNPMAGIVEGFRWSLLGVGNIDVNVLISCSISIILLLTGLWYFTKTEKYMADIL